MAAPSSFTFNIDLSQLALVKSELERKGCEFSNQPYAHFRAACPGLSVVAYKSGKLLVQGKAAVEFVEFFIEPKVTMDFCSREQPLSLDSLSVRPRVGIDESGKGDYFGSLVIGGFYLDGPDSARELVRLGVKDSKVIKSPVKIRQIIAGMKKLKGCLCDTVIIGPEAYNRLYGKFQNLNRLLAWGHARCIENILSKRECTDVIVDQFGNESLVKNALKQHGRCINLQQMHRAEADLAVAAASIVARGAYLDQMDKLSKQFDITLPKGASKQVKATARRFFAKHGMEGLAKVAKLHFKTTLEITQ